MKKICYVPVSLSFLIIILILTGCGKDSPTQTSSKFYPISWNRVVYEGDSILTVTELLGPKGARIGYILPGKYIARGTYDLTKSSYSITTGGDISLGFIGTIITMKDNKWAEKKVYSVPAGQQTGNYEVMQEILEVKSGPCNPDVVIRNSDRIILY